MTPLQELRRKSHEICAGLIFAEASVALTFCNIAQNALDLPTADQALGMAKETYVQIARFRDHLETSGERFRHLDDVFRELRTRLATLDSDFAKVFLYY